MRQHELINTEAVSVGWGEINNGSFPNILQTTTLRILSKHECGRRATALDPEGSSRRLILPENYVCSIGNPFVSLMWVSIEYIEKY